MDIRKNTEKKCIHVKVFPKAKENKVIGFEGEVLKVRCTASPEKGKANDAVIALLSAYFKVSKSAIRITKGMTSQHKIVEIMF